MTTDRDYASKEWLKEKTPFMVLAMDALAFVIKCVIVLALTACFAYVIGMNESSAAQSFRAMLEDSAEPATLPECQRTYPFRPRPDGTVSFQNGTGTPWHHRTCIYT